MQDPLGLFPGPVLLRTGRHLGWEEPPARWGAGIPAPTPDHGPTPIATYSQPPRSGPCAELTPHTKAQGLVAICPVISIPGGPQEGPWYSAVPRGPGPLSWEEGQTFPRGPRLLAQLHKSISDGLRRGPRVPGSQGPGAGPIWPPGSLTHPGSLHLHGGCPVAFQAPRFSLSWGSCEFLPQPCSSSF